MELPKDDTTTSWMSSVLSFFLKGSYVKTSLVGILLLVELSEVKHLWNKLPLIRNMQKSV